jgi:phosphatidylglycerol:prolipoprotein diacylglycerol transferase
VPLHPIEIYEMAAYFLVFLVVWNIRRKYRADGIALFAYLSAYGLARFVVEFFRGHPAIFAAGIPAAQVFAAAMIFVSLGGFVLLNKTLRFAR